ncbi:MAG: exodeoxyribonuclease VII large subunit [Desulfomonile tiedjei]|uniref:Exodeoxyribonuclease 7 large subunit n=1 Tax=Desulfomonile tiedjei TaxID=2358 RepID=A0A9D6V1Q6_9BACT|nr:exodeoxyribonuclease VII large subunit [Desulfomonile tiedjei]
MELPGRKIYTVSEFTEQIRELLEQRYPSVWIQGELSNLRPAPSGHMYFTLKDNAAQIRCVMFKMQNRFLKFRLQDGLQIIAWGRLSVYGPRGEYQLILDTMEPAGLGGLMLAFEQLKAKLAAEGLFDPGKRRPIPPLPKTVGLVTSSRGAVVRDMIRVLRRRFPSTNILVSPATVQGDRAPEQIIAALDRLCNAGGVDVIIVGRGGGSIEDLWAFNDERVVRSVAHCPIPIISAVGHETDVTLTDFAADLRASTPSVAAELVVPDRRDLQEAIIFLAVRLKNSMMNVLDKKSAAVGELLKRLYDPRRQIQEKRIRLDDLSARMIRAMQRKLEDRRRETEAFSVRLRPARLLRQIQTGKEECAALVNRFFRTIGNSLKDRRIAVINLAARLDSLSPIAVLARGYSIATRAETRSVVTDSRAVQIGEDLMIKLLVGDLRCRVLDKTFPEE